MASILDIIRSVIIAGIIAVMVFGVHLMTHRSAVENQVYQQMQGLSDGAIAILGEEIRNLKNFASTDVKIETNHLYFFNLHNNLVYLGVTEDQLSVLEVIIGAETDQGSVLSYDDEEQAIVLQGNPSIPPGSIITVISADELEDQTKIISGQNPGSAGGYIIKGNWDTIPESGYTYRINNSDYAREQYYSLNLIDRSDEDIYAFSLIQLTSDGSEATVSGDVMQAGFVYLIRADISLRSKAEDLYQDTNQEFVTNLSKDFYLRGFRLPDSGG